MFVVGWLLAMLGNMVPLACMHLVINHFIEKGWQGLLNIILTMFIYLKPDLMELQDEVEIMERLSVHSIKSTQIDW
jgi:hypothetical protein